jgi:hypothetical protein
MYINKEIVYFIVYLFLILGLIFIYLNKKLPTTYIVLLLFFLFKLIFNYRKCTFSYIECVLRGVKKDKGYLNTFLDTIIDMRFTNDIILLYFVSFYILFYHYVIKNNKFSKYF